MASEAWNARAVPWNSAWMLAGICRSSLARSIALTASPSDALGARLKDTVATGNWPWWLTTSGAFWRRTFVNEAKGTAPPSVERR